MTTTAEHLVNAPAIEVWPETTLRRFAELLEESSIGAALVRGVDGQVVGVVSERDVVRALAEGADPDVERVGDYMTFDVEFVSRHAPITALAEMMVADGIRHLPVEKENGGVIGVVSIRDVLAALRQPDDR